MICGWRNCDDNHQIYQYFSSLKFAILLMQSNVCQHIGMMLCACSTAVKDFRNIVSVVGGADEQQRAK